MLTIGEIRAAIGRNPEAGWQAEETEFLGRATAGGGGLFGLRVDNTVQFRAATKSFNDEIGAAPPPRVDWRTGQDACVTPVKDQTDCGACVAFATCAAMESDSIRRRRTEVLLSEGHLFHCNGGSCSNGWGLTSGLDASRGGVGSEHDLPWSSNGVCVEIEPKLTLRDYSARSTPRDRRQAVAEGPVLAGMRVYEDFLAYRSGIYRHVAGAEVGAHAVCVVGYDDGEGAWIVKNSWGARFGEDGFFRIAYGQCGLDSEFLFFSVETDPV